MATNTGPSSARPSVRPECPSFVHWNANVDTVLSFAAFAVCQSWRVAWWQRARSDSDTDRCNEERHTLCAVHFWRSARAGSFRMARERTNYICNRLHVFSTSVLLVFHTKGTECNTFTRQRAHGVKGGTAELVRRLYSAIARGPRYYYHSVIVLAHKHLNRPAIQKDPSAII